jgi:hypothetical protein
LTHRASVWHPIVHAEDELQVNGQFPRGPAISSGGTPTESWVELVARSAAPGAAAACPTDTMAGMAIKTNAKIHIHFELFARVMSDPFVKGVDIVAVVTALESGDASRIERHLGARKTSARSTTPVLKNSIGSSRAIHASGART